MKAITLFLLATVPVAVVAQNDGIVGLVLSLLAPFIDFILNTFVLPLVEDDLCGTIFDSLGPLGQNLTDAGCTCTDITSNSPEVTATVTCDSLPEYCLDEGPPPAQCGIPSVTVTGTGTVLPPEITSAEVDASYTLTGGSGDEANIVVEMGTDFEPTGCTATLTGFTCTCTAPCGTEAYSIQVACTDDTPTPVDDSFNTGCIDISTFVS